MRVPITGAIAEMGQAAGNFIESSRRLSSNPSNSGYLATARSLGHHLGERVQEHNNSVVRVLDLRDDSKEVDFVARGILIEKLQSFADKCQCP